MTEEVYKEVQNECGAIRRIVTMFSSAFGIAIIALPSGVITAGYLEEISKDK